MQRNIRFHRSRIGSHAGQMGSAGQVAYAASKAALNGLMLSWAREFSAHNVRINTVLPGVLPTPMTESLDPSVMRSYAQANVLGRINDPAEVRRLVAAGVDGLITDAVEKCSPGTGVND